MKFGLFIALLVLLASANVFGAQKTKVTISSAESKDTDLPVETVSTSRKESSRVVSRPATVEVNTDSKPDDKSKTNTVKVEITSGKTEGGSEVNTETHSEESKIDRQSSKERVTVIKGKTEHETGRKEEVLPTDEVIPLSEETHTDIHIDNSKERKPVIALPINEGMVRSENTVHVSGNIALIKAGRPVIDTVQYDLNGEHFLNGGRPLLPSQPFAPDFLARQSRITLYVATSKTSDPRSAFAKFPIRFDNAHFPFAFDIDVELPSEQRGLLDRADISLYFFVYITNMETNLDTFLPAGTSQILLQGTNRLVQKLEVDVRANGIEVNGLFRGRFGEQFIRAGTSLQVFIVPESSLSILHSKTFESVSQLTINSLPAMFPVPFSLMVNYQSLKANTKYFAVAYIFENGIQRPINQEPIWVINQQNILVTSQVIFNVVPSPFILRGIVSRAMPAPFFLQPRSSLILRLHQIGSDSQDIIYKLSPIVQFPQVFQINISQSARFDSSKKYDMRALITDEKNNIYMASLQAIPLLDELSRLIIPVDDLLYNVQVRLHASSNQFLTYIPGSSAQVFVTESPETPTKPIVAIRIDSIASDFRDFSIQVPATAIQRGRNYYLVMMIEINGMITHVSKTLLISNNQPPPFVIQLPVLSLNLVSGVIYDKDNRPAQWTSSSYANIYLVDDQSDNPKDHVVQVWKVHVENDFPIRFEVQLDFSRLRAHRVYRLQAAIENGLSLIEYKPAGSVLTLNSNGGIISDLRLPVENVKTVQPIKGLIYINDQRGPLPDKSEIIVQLSSSSSLLHPRIVQEIRIPVKGRTLPVDFTMDLLLSKVDLSSVYYFFVQYVVDGSVVIPVSQAFAYSLRNDALIVLTLSKAAQIPITGQVTSTGSPLMLPDGAVLHIYVTDNAVSSTPTIFSEVYLKSSLNNLYQFQMTVDSRLIEKGIQLFLRADVLYHDKVIVRMPRPALLQIALGSEWNINLVIDFYTLLVGQITSISQYAESSADLDTFIQIFESSTGYVVQTIRLRLTAKFPQQIRIEIDNSLFIQYSSLQARAIVKNCKEQILFESAGSVEIHAGLNLDINLAVVLTDAEKFKKLGNTINQTAALESGKWSISVAGVTVNSPKLVYSDSINVAGITVNSPKFGSSDRVNVAGSTVNSHKVVSSDSINVERPRVKNTIVITQD